MADLEGVGGNNGSKANAAFVRLPGNSAVGNGKADTGKTLPPLPASVTSTNPQAADQAKVSDVAEPSVEDIEQAVAKISDYIQSIQRDLTFSVDDQTGKSVITVRDSTTDEVVRQIPSEYLIQLAQNLNDLHNKLDGSKGNLIEARA